MGYTFLFPDKNKCKALYIQFFCVLRIFMSMCCVYLFFSRYTSSDRAVNDHYHHNNNNYNNTGTNNNATEPAPKRQR